VYSDDGTGRRRLLDDSSRLNTTRNWQAVFFSTTNFNTDSLEEEDNGIRPTPLDPYVYGISRYWTQAITPLIAGTVFVFVDEDGHSSTSTSTDRLAVENNTAIFSDGTLSILTRTDVNEQGTVTAAIVDEYNSTVTVL
jgi:hypothetical protein